MQSISKPVSFSFYKKFLQVKYLLVFGFVSGMVFISLLLPIFFDRINNPKTWSWVLFSISITSLTLYYLFFFFFWKNGNLTLDSYRGMILGIFTCVVILLFAELISLLVVYEILAIDRKVVFFVSFPIITISMFVGISLSAKFFFTWQKEAVFAKEKIVIK